MVRSRHLKIGGGVCVCACHGNVEVRGQFPVVLLFYIYTDSGEQTQVVRLLQQALTH